MEKICLVSFWLYSKSYNDLSSSLIVKILSLCLLSRWFTSPPPRLGIKSRASHTLGKYLTTELSPVPWLVIYFFKHILCITVFTKLPTYAQALFQQSGYFPFFCLPLWHIFLVSWLWIWMELDTCLYFSLGNVLNCLFCLTEKITGFKFRCIWQIIEPLWISVSHLWNESDNNHHIGFLWWLNKCNWYIWSAW